MNGFKFQHVSTVQNHCILHFTPKWWSKQIKQSCCIWSFHSYKFSNYEYMHFCSVSCWRQKRLRKHKASRRKRAPLFASSQMECKSSKRNLEGKTTDNWHLRNQTIQTHHPKIGCQKKLKRFENHLLSKLLKLVSYSLISIHRAGLPPQAAAEAPVMTCGVSCASNVGLKHPQHREKVLIFWMGKQWHLRRGNWNYLQLYADCNQITFQSIEIFVLSVLYESIYLYDIYRSSCYFPPL